MANLGRYRELPLPREWLEVLEGLLPFEATLQRPILPITVSLLEEDLMRCLDSRQADVIIQRYAKRLTLEALGEKYGVSRERVRQIEKKGLTRLKAYGRLRSAMSELIKMCNQGSNGFIIDSLSSKKLELTTEEAWLFIFRLYKKISGVAYDTKKSRHGYWLVFPQSLKKKGESFTLAIDTFIELDEAAQQLNMNPYQLIHYYELYGNLRLTHSTKLANETWTKVQCLEALATELAMAGYTEWHFSEMNKALAFVFPEKFTNQLGRNTAALINRSNLFQFVGRKGYWKLSSFGDGFDSTKEALINLLKGETIPVHVKYLYERLERNVMEQTVLAILAREEEFKSYGKGIFALKDKDYDDKGESVEAAWLLNYLSDKNINEISVEEASRLISAEGMEPWRLRTAVVLSVNLVYVRAGGTSKGEYYPATYQRASSYYQRQFINWYKYRRGSKSIGDDLLTYMLEHKIISSIDDIDGIACVDIEERFEKSSC